MDEYFHVIQYNNNYPVPNLAEHRFCRRRRRTPIVSICHPARGCLSRLGVEQEQLSTSSRAVAADDGTPHAGCLARSPPSPAMDETAMIIDDHNNIIGVCQDGGVGELRFHPSAPFGRSISRNRGTP